jgi:hypothetical protein
MIDKGSLIQLIINLDFIDMEILMREIQGLIDSLESYESMREKRLYFLKENFSNNEYMIHPSIIAQNWLSALCFEKKLNDSLCF